MKTIVCSECGEVIMLAEDEVVVSSYLVCESCFATLEITSDNPIEVIVVDTDEDGFEEDDVEEDEEL